MDSQDCSPARGDTPSKALLLLSSVDVCTTRLYATLSDGHRRQGVWKQLNHNANTFWIVKHALRTMGLPPFARLQGVRDRA